MIVLVGLLTLLYVQSLHGHIQKQSDTLSNNAKEISRLNNEVLEFQKEIKLAKELATLVSSQKEELANEQIKVVDKVTSAKDKNNKLTKVQKDTGDEIISVWEFYDDVTIGNETNGS